MDSAPVHIAAKTQEWLEMQEIKVIPKQEWMANSPDMAPMDYAINGNLKNNLRRRAARNRSQLVRVVRYQWSKLKIHAIRRALKSSQKRVQMMVDRDGNHVENVLN